MAYAGTGKQLVSLTLARHQGRALPLMGNGKKGPVKSKVASSGMLRGKQVSILSLKRVRDGTPSGFCVARNDPLGVERPSHYGYAYDVYFCARGGIMKKTFLLTAMTLFASAACSPVNDRNATAEASDAASADNKLSDNDEKSKMAGYQVIAKKTLENSLKDPDNANYKDVHGHKINMGNGDQYVFCGKINSKNSFGGYTGYEDFVAAAGIAAVESQVSDFYKIKNKLCGSDTDMGEVWF